MVHTRTEEYTYIPFIPNKERGQPFWKF
uniref:Uncharacterized protein n=1 Tax=Anguilla anguilla TaxID=7936 RepID=A0A0E9VMM0_ANGAN